MKIFINNQHIELPSDEMTVAELIAWRNIPTGGTAITINDRIVRKSDRESTQAIRRRPGSCDFSRIRG